jgi:hypothetical protein
MKTALPLLVAVLLANTSLHAQDAQAIPAEELAKATQLLMDANSRLVDPPLKFDLAPDRAVGLKAGEMGALIIPDKRLTAGKPDKDERKKSKGEILPLAQLWTLKLAPKDKDTVLSNDKLRLTKITAGDKELELAVFALGLERSAKQEFTLVVYGKGKEPVLRVPLTADKDKGGAPVTMSARKTGEDSGVLQLGLMGRFKAELPVGRQAD